MKRTIQTASLLPHPNKKQWKALEELDAGVCDGMTYEEIAVSVTRHFWLAWKPGLNLSMRLIASPFNRKNIQRITPIEMKINSTTDIEVER